VSHIELVSTTNHVGENVAREAGGAVSIVIRHPRPLVSADRQQLQQVLSTVGSDELTVNLWFQSQKGGVLADSSCVDVNPRLEYILLLDDMIEPSILPITPSLSFRFHPQDFIQSNPFINQQMVKQAIALLAPKSHETVMDLYCGIGNFSLPLALHAKHVLAVEGVDDMVARASENAQYNQIENITFIAQDLSQPGLLRASVNAYRQKQPVEISSSSAVQVKQNSKQTVKKGVIDALLLDPPRGGAKIVCENISELSPQRIVYVSCDSSTFARDAGLLADNGYRLSTLGVMDMFPQTSHVEIMALFVADSVVTDPSAKRTKKTHSSRSALARSSQSVIKPKRALKLG
jgi:23S rRNA (uracil1939-C5)-methyltransferase